MHIVNPYSSPTNPIIGGPNIKPTKESRVRFPINSSLLITSNLQVI